MVVAFEAGFVFGEAAGGVHAYPFEFLFEEFFAGGVDFLGLFGEGLFLFEPGLVVAFVGVGAAAVEFEDPFGDVGEKVAVVGDDDEGAFVLFEVGLEPADGFGVEVVGGFVEE